MDKTEVHEDKEENPITGTWPTVLRAFSPSDPPDIGRLSLAGTPSCGFLVHPPGTVKVASRKKIQIGFKVPNADSAKLYASATTKNASRNLPSSAFVRNTFTTVR